MERAEPCEKRKTAAIRLYIDDIAWLNEGRQTVTVNGKSHFMTPAEAFHLIRRKLDKNWEEEPKEEKT